MKCQACVSLSSVDLIRCDIHSCELILHVQYTARNDQLGFYRAMHYIVQSAVLRLHVVRPSVRLSVTLVDQDHVGCKSWKLTARTRELIAWIIYRSDV